MPHLWRVEKSQKRGTVARPALRLLLAITPHLAISAAFAGDLGVPITAPAPLNTNAAGDFGQDLAPDLAADGLGQWIAVWESNENLGGVIGSDYDIFIARSSNRGITWTPPAALNTSAGDDGDSTDRVASIVTDGLGQWIAVWRSNNPLGGAVGIDYDIFMARSADNGQTWTDPAPLNANAATDDGADFDPQVITDGQGLWVAAWRSLDTLTGTIGADADILIARSTDAGATWTYPVPLNTNAAVDSGQDIKPQLATDGLGHWVAAWHSNDTLGGTVGHDYDILFARSADNALTWSAPAPLNSSAFTDTRDDTDVSLTTDGVGVWIAVWSSEDSLNGTIGIDRDILYARSGDHGATWTAAAALNTNAASDSGQDLMPRLATDRQGQWVAIWQSSENLGGAIGIDDDILVAHSSNNGVTWSPPAPFNTNAASDSGNDDSPCLITDLHGAWLAAWHSRDSLGATIGTEGDVLHARFALPDCNQNTIPDITETDCNDNDVPDDCDIASGTSPDLNGNGIPDECEPPPPTCPADITGDGMVNVNDLLSVINAWGPCPAPPATCPADITADGVVSVNDLLAVINAWGPCP